MQDGGLNNNQPTLYRKKSMVLTTILCSFADGENKDTDDTIYQ